MKPWRVVLGIGFLLIAALTAGAGADTAKKLIGVWEMSKAEKLIPGATVEFTPDNKFVMRAKMGEKDLKMDGTFSVKDNVIVTIVKDLGGKDKTVKMKIKSLTDKMLVVEGEMGQAEEYKKK